MGATKQAMLEEAEKEAAATPHECERCGAPVHPDDVPEDQGDEPVFCEDCP